MAEASPITPVVKARLARFALLAPLALFAAFLLVVGFGLRHDPHREVRSALIGQPAPPFDLPGYDAAHPGLSSADLARGKVTLVNVFASWCVPCRVEAPQLGVLAREGVVVHAIAVHDSPEALQGFFARYGNPFRRVGLDDSGKAQIAWGSSGVPETFVIDGRGIVRHQHIGVIGADDIAPLLREIARAKAAS